MAPPPPARPWPVGRAALPAAFLGAALLSGCGPKADVFAPQCPDMKLLKDASDITRFNERGHDVTDMVLSGRIVAVPGSCKAGERGTVATTIQVSVELTRGPASRGRAAQVPYLVTVMDGDRIIDQKDYVIAANFPPNVDQVRAAGDPIDMLFPSTADKPAAAYTIYVSFRLTPDELQFNRAQGPR
ncbi:hypothetical protein OL599_18790 [Rhodovastum sp. RN2-1]|uniref:Uncharacterized protein n=2 Tax=Limobrevibacterium gyesilva TaxID=2991712 RepID=A0AA42CFH0_9PROT|nr:hypothetical protein [Limobrevibacterium gyesilva]